MHMRIVPFVSLEETIPEAAQVALERDEALLESPASAILAADFELSAEAKTQERARARAAGQTMGSCTVISCCWSVNKSHVLEYMLTCMPHVRVDLLQYIEYLQDIDGYM